LEVSVTRIAVFGLILSAALSFPALSEGSYITLETKTLAKLDGSTLHLEVEVTNKGDESARSLQIEATVLNQKKMLPLKDVLEVGETYKESADFEIDVSTPGRYPVILREDFADANQYPLSAISTSHFYVKENVPSRVVGSMEAIAISKEGRLALNLKNLEEKAVPLRVALVVPRELSVKDPTRKVSLQGRSKEDLSFDVENFSALPGGRYAVFAILEYELDGKHHSNIAQTVVGIEKEKDILQKYRLPLIIGIAVAGLLLVVLFIILQSRGGKATEGQA
jgi:ABC-type Fe3+-siderophore transport system permease subunit